MLKAELDIMKKNEAGGVLQTGACKFCGQITQIETDGWDAEKCDEACTELCDCTEAYIYTTRKAQKERAIEAINEQFGQQSENAVDESVIDLLEQIAHMLVEHDIKKATIDIGNGLEGKLTTTPKGNIKVERTKKEKATQEV